jgi:hypothetical protein
MWGQPPSAARLAKPGSLWAEQALWVEQAFRPEWKEAVKIGLQP